MNRSDQSEEILADLMKAATLQGVKKAWMDNDDEEESVHDRLEHLRGELRAERISQGELIELQSLAEYIDPGDVELLEAAGVEEFPEPVVHEKTYNPTEEEKKMLKNMGIQAQKRPK